MDQKRKTTRRYPDKIWSIIQDPKGCVKFFKNDWIVNQLFFHKLQINPVAV